ncbi:MAG: SDR family NAD(P)-dependent oxidoreductase [Candidatus Nanohaloarchaea archaeon]
MRVVITGGASGIGRATVEKLLERGHHVTVIDNDSEALEELPGEVERHEIDVRDDELSSFLEEREIDVLVNCAGFQEQGSVEDMPLETFEKHVEVNYLGTVRAIKACLPRLKESGGRIVNISSLAGRMTVPFLGAYSASKYAVEGFSDALRMELAGSGVETVIVEPGPVKTGFNEQARDALERYLPGTDYEERYRERLGSDMEGVEPEKAADVVVKAVESDRPKARYTVTWQAWLGPKLKLLLPVAIYDYLAGKLT